MITYENLARILLSDEEKKEFAPFCRVPVTNYISITVVHLIMAVMFSCYSVYLAEAARQDFTIVVTVLWTTVLYEILKKLMYSTRIMCSYHFLHTRDPSKLSRYFSFYVTLSWCVIILFFIAIKIREHMTVVYGLVGGICSALLTAHMQVFTRKTLCYFDIEYFYLSDFGTCLSFFVTPLIAYSCYQLGIIITQLILSLTLLNIFLMMLVTDRRLSAKSGVIIDDANEIERRISAKRAYCRRPSVISFQCSPEKLRRINSMKKPRREESGQRLVAAVVHPDEETQETPSTSQYPVTMTGDDGVQQITARDVACALSFSEAAAFPDAHSIEMKTVETPRGNADHVTDPSTVNSASTSLPSSDCPAAAPNQSAQMGDTSPQPEPGPSGSPNQPSNDDVAINLPQNPQNIAEDPISQTRRASDPDQIQTVRRLSPKTERRFFKMRLSFNLKTFYTKTWGIDKTMYFMEDYCAGGMKKYLLNARFWTALITKSIYDLTTTFFVICMPAILVRKNEMTSSMDAVIHVTLFSAGWAFCVVFRIVFAIFTKAGTRITQSYILFFAGYLLAGLSLKFLDLDDVEASLVINYTCLSLFGIAHCLVNYNHGVVAQDFILPQDTDAINRQSLTSILYLEYFASYVMMFLYLAVGLSAARVGSNLADWFNYIYIVYFVNFGIWFVSYIVSQIARCYQGLNF